MVNIDVFQRIHNEEEGINEWDAFVDELDSFVFSCVICMAELQRRFCL